ncbi:uncharacterized protein L201_002644 [Kwoniella dendrophila CBS 6074]|uniref:Uncharacterized protein n=1 Tax=Kwoniella dendrophila CBS 6074 TaxID=1295534 RepID=A0AAX4JQV9_9TREE
MLLFTTLHLFLPVVSALPSKSISSILTLNKQSQDELPYGRTPLSKGDMMEIGRMATMINSAYCSNESKLQPHISNSFVNQAKSNRRHYHYQPEHDYHTEGNSIIISSDKPEFVVDRRVGGDMRWYISHTPSTQTLSLTMTP